MSAKEITMKLLEEIVNHADTFCDNLVPNAPKGASVTQFSKDLSEELGLSQGTVFGIVSEHVSNRDDVVSRKGPDGGAFRLTPEWNAEVERRKNEVAERDRKRAERQARAGDGEDKKVRKAALKSKISEATAFARGPEKTEESVDLASEEYTQA